MPFNAEIFKKHPYGSAIGGVIIFIVVYLMMKSRTASSSASNTSTTANGTNQYDAQIASVNAASGVQSMQVQAQLQAASISAASNDKTVTLQAQTAAEQIAAQLEAIKVQTSATVVDNAAKIGGDVALAQIQANSQTAIEQVHAQEVDNQTAALVKMSTNQTDNQTQQHADTLTYLTAVADIQGKVTSDALKYKSVTDTAAISHVKDFNGSQNRVALLESVTGNYGGAIVNAESQTGANTNGSTNPAAVISSIGTAAGSIMKGLFV